MRTREEGERRRRKQGAVCRIRGRRR